MELVKLSKEEFDSFVKKQACDNFLQSKEMFSRYEAKNREAYLLGLKDNNELKAVTLAVKTSEIKGQKIFSLPGGPILDYSAKDSQTVLDAFLKEIKTFLKKQHGFVLQFSPNVAVKNGESSPRITGAKYLGEYVQVKWISILDLSPFKTTEELFKTFRKGHRYSIKYTDSRFHLDVRELGRDELKILKSLEDKAAKKHSFRAQPLSYYEELYDAFKDKIKVLAAFYENQPVAAAMFIYYGHEVVYLYSGADPTFDRVAGSYAIQWKMLTFAHDNGFKRYNFYGVRPEAGNGVYEFKAGFRAEVEELWGTYMLPLSPLGKLYVARKKYHKFGELA